LGARLLLNVAPAGQLPQPILSALDWLVVNEIEVGMIAAKLASYGWVALGSALGGVSRYWLGGVVARGIGQRLRFA